MPREKDLKRLVRTRMQTTGESYTTARSQIEAKTPSRRSRSQAVPDMDLVEPVREAPAPTDIRPDYATIAGVSDEALKAKTGCDWERWVYALDRHFAHELPHREIARLVNQEYGIEGWWSQCVAVGYERIKGLRDRGQRRGGAYEASKSRTFPVPVEKLYDAWAQKRTRRRWLTDADPQVRTGKRPRSLRLVLEDGTTAALWFEQKGEAKSSVTVQHMKLADRAASDRSKKEWAGRLDALAALFAKG